jgi:small subunit ribosomal protein S16
MATAIRLRRGGRKGAPYYRVIVVDSRDRSRGRIIEQLGVYQPCAKPEPVIEIDDHKALDWLKKGAQPSDTLRNVFKRRGLMEALATGAELKVEEPVEEAAPTAEAEAAAEAPAPEAKEETPAEAPQPEAADESTPEAADESADAS